MSRTNPLLSTPDFMTGDDIVAFLGQTGKPARTHSTEWKCTCCGSLYIFDRPALNPAEDCRSCGSMFWKANPADD